MPEYTGFLIFNIQLLKLTWKVVALPCSIRHATYGNFDTTAANEMNLIDDYAEDGGPEVI